MKRESHGSFVPRAIGRSLPPDLEKAAARRFSSLCLILFVGIGLAGVLRNVAAQHGAHISADAVAIANVASAIFGAVALGLFFYSRRSKSPKNVLRVAIAFELLLCFTLAQLESTLVDLRQPTLRVSFVAIALLTFPLVIPTRPIVRLLTTLGCAAMLPLAIAVAERTSGVQVAGPDMALLVGPTFAAAGLALAVAPIVHGLTQEAQKARLLGAYELVERLGRGGMGEVWRARHRMLARPAAVKLIRPDMLGPDAEAARVRFEREARATSALSSPNTIEIYDFGVAEDGTFFYVMELLEGFDIDVLVRDHGPQPAARVAHLLRQACRSLADAHGRGLVHRDIKPANVFLCRKGVELDWVKVLDFGLVKEIDAGEGGASGGRAAVMVSRENTITGTPAFMPPEAALTGDVDARSDLYSLGCVAYFMLSGELPFDGDSPMDVIVKHVKDAPVPPSVRAGVEVPEALEALVLACLAKRPDDRPESAAKLGQMLADAGLAPWTEDDARAFWEAHAGALLTTQPASIAPPARDAV